MKLTTVENAGEIKGEGARSSDDSSSNSSFWLVLICVGGSAVDILQSMVQYRYGRPVRVPPVPYHQVPGAGTCTVPVRVPVRNSTQIVVRSQNLP